MKENIEEFEKILQYPNSEQPDLDIEEKIQPEPRCKRSLPGLYKDQNDKKGNNRV